EVTRGRALGHKKRSVNEMDFVVEEAKDGDDEESDDAAVASGEVEDDADGGGDGGDEGASDIHVEDVAREGVAVGVVEAGVFGEGANDDDEEQDDGGLGEAFGGRELHVEESSSPQRRRDTENEALAR